MNSISLKLCHNICRHFGCYTIIRTQMMKFKIKFFSSNFYYSVCIEILIPCIDLITSLTNIKFLNIISNNFTNCSINLFMMIY